VPFRLRNGIKERWVYQRSPPYNYNYGVAVTRFAGWIARRELKIHAP